jgi:glycolate oxidase FAD binding subunit
VTRQWPARDPKASDAIAGVSPRTVFEPRSREECAAIFAHARAGRLSMAVVGGGTELGLGAPPARLDAVVSTRRLDRVLEYSPSDQVVSVEAGITLSALQDLLAKSRQRLACDPPVPEAATVGGLLATAAFGPLRTRYGALRDLIIGVSLLRADGTRARGGGKVVKNVAGFDLPKLAAGSLGTLGMIETATFRLHPLPEADATVCARDLASVDVRRWVIGIRQAQLEPAALVAIASGGSTFRALARFEGFAAGVREQCDGATAAARELGRSADVLSSAEAAAAWDEHQRLRTQGNTRLKLATAPSELPVAVSAVVPILTNVLSRSAVVVYPTLGVGFISGHLEASASAATAFAAAVTRARVCATSAKGSLVVAELPNDARAAVDVWGPPPPSFSIMKRIKERFDPERRMNAGRFVGGL